jgi:hypothetical protein
MSAYSLAVGNDDWIEGTGTGGVAASGEPCWDARKADGAGGVTEAWAGSAGASTSGTDYEPTLLGSSSVPKDVAGTPWDTTLTTSRVQGWFGTPNTNYGMRLSVSGNQGGVPSSEWTADASWRPKLTVVYALPTGSPPTLRRQRH